MRPKNITRERFDAVLFDLDGVITDTAKVHAVCWKRMFDSFLRKHAEEKNWSFSPSTSRKTTRSMWTASYATKVSAASSKLGRSISPLVRPMTHLGSNRSPAWEISRTDGEGSARCRRGRGV